jgi:hypothetical protein
MITLRESIEIVSSPEEVFDWFRNLDKNYTAWHSDHIKWVFEEGFMEGARCRVQTLVANVNGVSWWVIRYRTDNEWNDVHSNSDISCWPPLFDTSRTESRGSETSHEGRESEPQASD